MSLEDLVRGAKRGDGECFYKLVEERQNSLYKIAFSYVKNKDDALDIVSETIYKAFVNIKKLKDPNMFNTWITRILINTAIDFLNKNKKCICMTQNMDIYRETYEKNSEELMDLYSAMDKLNEKYKTIIILKFFQGLTIGEIANILECPVGTVKSGIHRALKELRFELKEGVLNESI